MLQIGRRIIYNKVSGRIILDMGEYQGGVLPRDPIEELAFLDLEYGQDKDKFMRAKKYHIDTDTKTVVLDELYEPVETEEEKLRREKAELENQLLLQADNNLNGGIL